MSELVGTHRITTEIALVTPAMASEWLAEKGPNRKLRKSVVGRYAVDMAAGCWRLTHQGICFDENGRLIDGQHRLAAIMAASVDVLMMVVRGVPASAQLDMDQIAKRSVSDALNLVGIDADKTEVAIANAMQAGVGQARSMTPESTRRFLLEHGAAVKFSMGLMTTKLRAITTGPVGAAVARAWYYEDHGRLSQFIDILKTGMPGEPVSEDSAAIVLRQNLLAHAQSGTSFGYGSSTRRAVFGKTCRAIQAFCARELTKQIKTPSRDIYPLLDRVPK